MALLRALTRKSSLEAPQASIATLGLIAHGKRKLHAQSSLLKISEEIRAAVHEKQPVVALETTIYTHGFPFPENLQLAKDLESLVRSNGGIPATCGVLDGVARVGLDAKELEMLTNNREARKISRRDFGFVAGTGLYTGKKLTGGTTISGTCILAHLAGIKVFGTGGLGGVHFPVSSLDISADLTEIGRTPVAVISSGCKGFLDIPRTLEYLETEGVGVATFADGRTGSVDFPAFWSRESGVVSPMVVENEAEAAAMIYAQHTLGLSSGLLFANPIPVGFEIPRAELADIIQEALRLADAEGVIGSANTPFILSAIKELSGGRSIPANRALIESNIIKATNVAVELSILENKSFTTPQPEEHRSWNSEAFPRMEVKPAPISYRRMPNLSPVDLLVAGSVAMDLSCHYTPDLSMSGDTSPIRHTSNPCTISRSVGGVGHNIAKAAHAWGASVRLCSVVADDEVGRAVINAAQASGLDIGAVRSLPAAPDHTTAQYISFNDAAKSLVMAMADMRILEHASHGFNETTIDQYIQASKPSWLIVDANWDAQTLMKWVQRAKEASVAVAFEPVSTAKASRLFAGPAHSIAAYPHNTIDLASPNALELTSMHEAARKAGLFEREDWWDVIDALGISSAGARTELVRATSKVLVDAGIPQQCIQLLPFIPVLLTKLGSGGVLLTQLLSSKDERLRSPKVAPYVLSRTKREAGDVGGVYMRLFPVAEEVKGDALVSVNGAGDTFLGVILAALAATENKEIENVVDIAQAASVLTLKSREAVSPELAGLRRSLKGEP